LRNNSLFFVFLLLYYYFTCTKYNNFTKQKSTYGHISYIIIYIYIYIYLYMVIYIYLYSYTKNFLPRIKRVCTDDTMALHKETFVKYSSAFSFFVIYHSNGDFFKLMCYIYNFFEHPTRAWHFLWLFFIGVCDSIKND